DRVRYHWTAHHNLVALNFGIRPDEFSIAARHGETAQGDVRIQGVVLAEIPQADCSVLISARNEFAWCCSPTTPDVITARCDNPLPIRAECGRVNNLTPGVRSRHGHQATAHVLEAQNNLVAFNFHR